MLQLKRATSALLLLLAPLTGFSHPGHADGSPLLHEVSHSLHYLVALVAVGIWTAKIIGRVTRSKTKQTRSLK